MAQLYAVEVEPEVRAWLEELPDRDFGRVDFLVGLLAEHAGRALQAQKTCEAEHGPAHDGLDREVH